MLQESWEDKYSFLVLADDQQKPWIMGLSILHSEGNMS